MKPKHGLALLTALLIVPFAAIAKAFAPAGIDALNIQGGHEGGYTRIAEGAIAAHLLLTPGTNPATQAKLCTAALDPIGTAYDDTADTGRVGIERLLDGNSKIMIASKAIAAGVRVYATAGGKITDAVVTGARLVGRSISAANADGDELEVDPLHPVINP